MGTFKIPVEEIRFTAKSGFLPRAIWEDFFAVGVYSWRIRTWKNFLKRGHFKRHPSPTLKDHLVLNTRHPEVIKIVGNEISPAPYVFQAHHDEVISRSVLLLKRGGLIQSFLTEAEIKMQNVGRQRIRGPQDRIKYPDMITYAVKNESSLSIALELELTRKDYKRYYQIVGCYSQRFYADKVIFIARSEGVFDALRKALRENSYSNPRQAIGFCSFLEWEQSPSEAPIYFNNKVTSILEMTKNLEAIPKS